MTAVTQPRTTALDLSLFRGLRFYAWMTGVALLAGVVSLHWPATPSYDPYSWLIWGREIFHAVTGSGPAVDSSLHIAGGSSWKPMPVIFTTIFAAFGSAQANLWLIVARAGMVMSVLMSAKLAGRITWGFVAQGREPGWLAELGVGARLAALTPVALAAAIALVGTGFMPRYPVPMMLGYSEGLGFALTLIVIERAWDGHHRQAFALGLLPCLDRPELWVVWGLYGLWLMRRDRSMIPFVLGLGVLMLLLWVIPQDLGGGKVTSLATHAHGNHGAESAVNSSFPFWHELYKVIWPLALERVEAAGLIAIAVTAWLLVRDRREQGGWLASARTHGPAVAAALAAAAGFVWWIGISLETQAGFAGNPRYTVIGVLLVYVGGAAAYGWACVGMARLVGALVRRRRARQLARSPRLAGASVLMALVFLFVPGWFAHRLPTFSSVTRSLHYQAWLRENVASLVEREGGGQKIMACGSVMTNNYQVTMLAWYLQVPIPFVQALPRQQELNPNPPSPKRGPNVVFQDGAVSDTPGNLQPIQTQMDAWDQGWQAATGTRYRVTSSGPVTLYMNCNGYSRA